MQYNKDNPLKVFEAFAGYGSQSVALERLKRKHPGFDYKVVGISEIEMNAIAAYNALHGHPTPPPNFGSITEIDWSHVPNFDLLTYSFPCTDISASGLQKGFDENSGTRSSLLWQVRKAVVAKRPKFLLMENVKALTQKKFMPLFNKWQQELEHYGYTNFYKVHNATQFNVPQNRERVFMVSVLGAEQDYQFPQPIKLTKTIADVLEQDVGEQYFLNQHVVEKYLEVTADTTHNHNLGLRSRSDIAFTIRAKAGGRVDDNYIAYVEEK